MMRNDLILFGVRLLSAGIVIVGGWRLYKLAYYTAALFLSILDLILSFFYLFALLVNTLFG